MLADEHPDFGALAPQDAWAARRSPSTSTSRTSTPCYQAALDAGATEPEPSRTSSTATASRQFEDPFGHHWSIATHVEDVSPEEMEKRAAEAMSG